MGEIAGICRTQQKRGTRNDYYKMKSKKPEIHEYARLKFEFNSGPRIIIRTSTRFRFERVQQRMIIQLTTIFELIFNFESQNFEAFEKRIRKLYKFETPKIRKFDRK